MSARDVDVVVAGAGPAGAAAALILARAGCRVLIVDRSAFPRDKVCGDLLGADAVASLGELGVATNVLGGAVAVSGAILHGPRGTCAGDDGRAAPHAARPGDARMLPRRLLDARLLDRARAAGAGFAVCRALGVLRDGNGRIRGLRTSTGNVRATVTIGAEGWGSPVARALGIAAPGPGFAAPTIRAYATGVADLRRRMHFFINRRGDGYAWVFPLPDGRANVGLGFQTGEGDGGLRAAFERFTGPASPARALLEGAGFDAPVAWPIPLGWRAGPVSAAGALLAGDAAGLASPLSGSGIQNALASGSGAARYALRALGGDAGAWHAYARWLRMRLATRLRLERAAHAIAGTPERVEPWLAIANAVPGAGPLLSRALLALG